MGTKTYSAFIKAFDPHCNFEVPFIPRHTLVAAVQRFVPNAEPELQEELIEQMKKDINSVHCTVLAKRRKPIARILEKFNATLARNDVSFAVIINEKGAVRTLL